jgi:hypothetical protein
LANEVGQLISDRIGQQVYAQKLANCQLNAINKSIIRKRKLAESAIINPQLIAQKKIRKQKKKVDSRKRRINTNKPHRLIRQT